MIKITDMKTRSLLKITRNIFLLLSFVMITSSCDVLQQVAELQTFSKCKFRLSTIENIRLAGVNVQGKDQFSDFTITEAAKITAALLGGELPLDFRLNVETKNPNAKTAALNKLDWILFIDDIEMTRGTTNQRIEIPANGGVRDLPLHINVDLKEILSGKSKDALLNFGLNLSGQGNRPSRITVKAKPTVYVSGQAVNYPGYITIRNEFN